MKLLLRSIFFLIVATFSPLASAQELFWVGGSQGDFNTATNWNTEQSDKGTFGVPGPTNIAAILPDNVYTEAPYVITVTMSQDNTVQGLKISHYLEFFIDQSDGNVTLSSPNGSTLTIAGVGTAGTGTYQSGDLIVDANNTLNLVNENIAVTNGVIVIGDDYNGPDPDDDFNGPGTFLIKSGTFTFDPGANKLTEMDLGNGPGATGTVTQGVVASGTTPASSSIVVTGNILNIGYGGGTGTWNVTNGSTLETGTQAGVTYVIALGANATAGSGFFGGTGNGSVGTLNIDDTSLFVLNSGGDLQLGTVATVTPGNITALTGGTGILNQNDASMVNLAGTSTVEVGDALDGTGTYNLNGGTLNVGVQAGDSVAFAVGATPGAVGNLLQAGGILNVGNSTVANGTTFIVGDGGTGTYTMTGGVANFYNALDIGLHGTVNLNGGTLNIAAGNLIGNPNGFLDFGGGTLNFTGGTTFTDNFKGGVLAGNTNSTIDASVAGLNTVTFANPLSGGGGITLIGNGTTTFSFASVGGGAANTYSGSTSILNGTLNATAADFAGAFTTSTLTIGASGAPAILNLALGTASTTVTIPETIAGNGTLNVNFNEAGQTLSFNNTGTSLSTVNIVLAANTGPAGFASLTPGTLHLNGGSYGSITEVGAGNNLVVGTDLPNSSGTVTIGTAGYTGTTTIYSGFTLNATSLTSDVTVGTPALPGGTLNVTGAAGVTGSVTNNGGTVDVTGAAGIVGDVTNNDEPSPTPGNPNFIGAITTTSVTGNVTNSGTFTASAATGTVSGNLTNNSTGIITATSALPAVAMPTFTVGGNLILSNGGTGGTLNVRLNGTVTDDYHVTGTATLDNGVINVQVLGGGQIGVPLTYQIVTGASVTDAGTTLSPNTALFTYMLQNTGTAENLIVTQAPLTTYALTPNQRAVASALDGTNSPLFSYFAGISLAAGPTAIPVALDELSPETLQYARIIAFENSTFLAERVNAVCADLRGGYGGLDTNAISVVTPGFESGLGRSMGSLLAANDPSPFHTSAPNGVNYYPGGSSGPSSSSSESESAPAAPWNSSSQVISDTPNPYLASANPSAEGAPRTSEFIGGDVVLADLNQNNGVGNAPPNKASYTAGDATAGVSFRMTNHLAAGILFNYNHTDAKVDNSGSKTDVDSYSPGIFATYFDHGFYANGLFSFGYNDYSNTRDISVLNEEATSHPTGQQYVGDLDAGYDFHPAKNWVVGPTLGVTYTHLDIDSFTESGAPGANLAVEDQSADSLRSRLGGHVIFQTNTGDVLLQPNITAMWQHEYLDDASGITSSFAGYSGPFTIQTAAPSRDSALIGCGITATLNTSMAFYLNYLADVGNDDYFAQSIIGGFKARF